MPIYEYECEGCLKVHEISQKFSDAPMAVCPDCAKPVRKLISRSSFSLKGSGWYTTDYKRAPQPSASTEGNAERDAKTGSDSAGSDSPKGDSAKPETAKPEAAKQAGSEKPKIETAKSDSTKSSSDRAVSSSASKEAPASR